MVKFYHAVPVGPGHYAGPNIAKTTRDVIMGAMDKHEISTSSAERQNLTKAYANAPVHQIDQGLSKKLENLKAAVALHFYHHNFVRLHGTKRVTPNADGCR